MHASWMHQEKVCKGHYLRTGRNYTNVRETVRSEEIVFNVLEEAMKLTPLA
jgi:hypothetical protein